jgi:hypothetical protein
VFDRVNLTYHLMDRSNQFDSERNPIFIDADIDEDDIDRPLQPGQPMQVSSSDDTPTRAAKVEWPITGNALRPAMMEYARDLRKQILDAAGSVELDEAAVTNKGNLTRAVLEQLYDPQIRMTHEKRKSYGHDGLVPFLALVALGLQESGRAARRDGRPGDAHGRAALAGLFRALRRRARRLHRAHAGAGRGRLSHRTTAPSSASPAPRGSRTSTRSKMRSRRSRRCSPCRSSAPIR